MAENKSQHYVPQFYLKFFSDTDYCIFTYNLKTKKINKMNIRNTCRSDYFYGRNIDLEKALSVVEQKQAESLKKLVSTHNFDTFRLQDYTYLALFILVQYSRTKEGKRIAEQFVENYYANIIKPILKNSRDLKEKGITDDIIDATSYKYPEMHNYSMLISFLSIELITDLKLVLVINRTEMDFICSDSPVIKYNNKIANERLLAWQSPGLQVYCPLSPKILLLLIDDNYYDLKLDNSYTVDITKISDIQAMNKLQFVHCSSNIFFANSAQENYIRKMHEELNSEIVEYKKLNVTVSPVKTLSKESGEIIKIDVIQNDGNYKPKIYFIKLNHARHKIFKAAVKDPSFKYIDKLVRSKERCDNFELKMEQLRQIDSSMIDDSYLERKLHEILFY